MQKPCHFIEYVLIGDEWRSSGKGHSPCYLPSPKTASFLPTLDWWAPAPSSPVCMTHNGGLSHHASMHPTWEARGNASRLPKSRLPRLGRLASTALLPT